MLNNNQKQELLNKVILKRYKITSWFKDGGLSSIFLAEDLNKEYNVLIKIIKIDLLNNSDKKYFDELKIYKKINYNNDNIVKIYDYSIDQEYFYIVIEHIEGISLEDFIKINSIITWTEAKYITLQIINAIKPLHYNNSAKIIHRDIKPQNIIINPKTLVAKLIDFGISSLINDENILSEEKDLFCSPFYSSPDVLELTQEVRALNNKESIEKFKEIVSFQLDIHSIGVILFEMLTKRLPFKEMYNESLPKRNRVLIWIKRDIPKVSTIRLDIPEDLDLILFKATASKLNNKKQRYNNIFELEKEILAIPDELNIENNNYENFITKDINSQTENKYKLFFKNKFNLIILLSIIFILIFLIVIIILYVFNKR